MGSPRHFVIATIGHTLSDRIAWALDLHPLVKCSLEMAAGHLWSHETGRKVAHEATDQGRRLGLIGKSMTASLRANASLDEVFDILSYNVEAPAIGDVGGYSVASLLQCLESYGASRREIATAVLVRHPVPWINDRIESLIDLAKTNPTGPDISVMTINAQGFLQRNAGIEKHLDFDPGDTRAMATIDTATRFFKEMSFEILYADNHASWTVCPIERLLEARATLASVLGQLTAGTAQATPDYLDQAYDPESGPLGMGLDPRTPADIFAEWAPYQKGMFIEVLRRSGTVPAFAKCGYDFSFAG